ncbi:PTS sugar transporter subunit IIB [Paratissierella segnis]|jgi:D-glucosaminate-specific PTS system IIB component|uniref:PTS sugar transporter subunit IIB n=1 Tax=Paratissierella segnis TaxID=2763679 RepID=A0A926EXS2_9FIRM|nr:PTS sugar transporter subunit IIB [Paratissierella segnis]MBC8588190.1 PTS sugar transporter subunit IIB [Paratissierella segnis]
MAEIALVRIDSRLIHGQVVTRWVKQTQANKIIIIDDALAQDEFMAQVYILAAPSNVSVEVYGVDEVAKNWDKNKDDKILFLFRGVNEAYNAWNAGFKYKNLQIGGIGSAPGRINVHKNITLNEEDVEKLKELEAEGVNVYLHILPDEKEIEFDHIVNKYF